MTDNRIVDKLGEMTLDGEWKWFHTNRYGKERMLELVKYRIDVYHDFEISNDYTKFRKIVPPKEQIPKNNESTYFIEWRNQSEVDIDYSHLPEPTYTPTNKIVKRRAQ